MSLPAGVTPTPCRSCKASIWFGLVWGSPCPIDVIPNARYPFAATGDRRSPTVHHRSTAGRRYVELDNRAAGATRWRIHHCDVSRREQLASTRRDLR